MGNTAASVHDQPSSAALLRENLVSYFEVGDLESLCFDLGLDYDGLSGDGKAAKVVKVIEYFSRNGRIVDLIDRCAHLRPTVDWSGLRLAALMSPESFRAATPPVDADSGRQILNLPADRALKIGIFVGVLAMLLVVCAFSGGLFASRFISVTFAPVPVSQEAGGVAVQELRELQFVPSGATVELNYDNIKATSLADQLLVFPDSPVSEVHIQFLDGGDVVMNTRMTAFGNRRVVTAMAIVADGGRLILKPKAVALDLLGLPNTYFGWVLIPVDLMSFFTDWLQHELDTAAANYWFERILVTKNHMLIDLHPR